jgi:drug/metabolite transporter (DMT)-like permease
VRAYSVLERQVFGHSPSSSGVEPVQECTSDPGACLPLISFRSRRWTLAPLGALTLGVLAVALWSGSTVVEKSLLRQIPPLTLLVWQLGSSVTLLWGAVLYLQVPLPDQRDLLRLSWPGLVQPGLANLLLLLGLSLTNATVFAFLNALETPFGLLFAHMLLGERLKRPAMVLAGLATIGVLMVALSGPNDGQQSTFQGLFLVLCGTVFAALYGAVSQSTVLESQSDPLLLTALHQTLAFAAIMIIWALVAVRGGELPSLLTLPAMTWGLAALAGIFQYALPFWLFLLALRSLKVSSVTLMFTLGPVFVLSGAFLFLGERLSVLQTCGSALTLAALVVVSWHQGQSEV